MNDAATLEWLAELVDREPTAEERDRLEAHPELQQELAALKSQTEALGGLPSMQPPRGDWQMLEARLMSEGLIRHRKNTLLTLPLSSGWTRAAAAAALFIAGAGTGMSLANQGVTLSPQSVASGAPSAVENIDDAEQAVAFAEQQYLNTLLRYRQLQRASGSWSPPSGRSRAQALDLLVQAGESALRQAPDDPFFNFLLINALAEKQGSTADEDNWF